MKKLLATVLATAMFTGCYFGHNRTAKHAAYAGNAVVGTLGTVLLLATELSKPESCAGEDFQCGVDGQIGKSINEVLSGTMIAGALIGTAINIMTSTHESAPVAPAPAARPAAAPAYASVSAPGLESAEVPLK